MSLFGAEDLIELLGALPRAQITTDYTEQSRAQDFVNTFETPHGQRTLAWIARICEPGVQDEDVDSHGALASSVGARRVFLEIQRCMVYRNPITHEVRPDPRQRSKETTDGRRES